jgi:spectrin beta
MLRDRFKEFAHDTEAIGQERVAVVNEACDKLISAGHSDAAVIAEWKDTINEMWTDLLEMIDTRTQMLAASYELFKFYNDCKETLDRIHEKEVLMPDEVGDDARTTAALQRRHQTYEQELIALGQQVQAIQEAAANLIVAYSGEKAREIQNHEMEVVNAWRNLQIRVDGRRAQLADSNDLYRFFSMAKDLLNWMNDITRQMNSHDKPRDVSGVELLMNNHQSLRAEIDARAENFTICVNLGRDILSRRHPRSDEVRDKLVQLATQRGEMMENWEERWEYLQLILEVYQFARDAAVAESWLMAHESYVYNEDFGDTLAAVELLLKKHEAFERSAATQEERFHALERLTTFELRERQKKQQQDSLPSKQNYVELYKQQFVPPPEPLRVSPTPPVTSESTLRQTSPQLEQTPTTHVTSSEEPVQSTSALVMDKPPVAMTTTQTPAASSTTTKKSSSLKTKSVERAPSSKSAQSAGATSIEGEEGSFSGTLVRKHQWESTTKKASHRGWDKVFVVLSNKNLSFFKDQKHSKSEPKTYYNKERPIELDGCSAAVATDYAKRPNVFRVKLANGGDFLFQCRDEEEMNSWMSKINAAGGGSPSEPTSGRAATLPSHADQPRSAADEPKKRGFFTLGKKKDKD